MEDVTWRREEEKDRKEVVISCGRVGDGERGEEVVMIEGDKKKNEAQICDGDGQMRRFCWFEW